MLTGGGTCVPVAEDPGAPEGHLVHRMVPKNEKNLSSQTCQAPHLGPWRKLKKLDVRCSREAVFIAIISLPPHVPSQSTLPAAIVGLD